MEDTAHPCRAGGSSKPHPGGKILGNKTSERWGSWIRIWIMLDHTDGQQSSPLEPPCTHPGPHMPRSVRAGGKAMAWDAPACPTFLLNIAARCCHFTWLGRGQVVLPGRPG